MAFGYSIDGSIPSEADDGDALVALRFGFAGEGLGPSIGSGEWLSCGASLMEMGGNSVIVTAWSVEYNASSPPDLTMNPGGGDGWPWDGFGAQCIIVSVPGIDAVDLVGYSARNLSDDPISFAFDELTIPSGGIGIIAVANWNGTTWVDPSGFTGRMTQGWNEIAAWVRSTPGPIAPTVTTEGGSDHAAGLFLVLGPGGGSGPDEIEGALALTAQGSAVSAAGGPSVGGTMSVPGASASLAASATSEVSASFSGNLQPSLVSALGTVLSEVVAQLAVSLADSVASASGGPSVAGTASVASAASVSAAGGSAVSGSASKGVAPDGVSATAGSSISGGASKQLAPATLTASAGGAVSATASKLVDGDTLTATGGASISAALSVTLDESTVSTSGGPIVGPTGTLSASLGDSVVSAAGSPSVVGQASREAPLSVSGQGGPSVSGQASTVTSGAALALGSPAVSAALAKALEDATVQAQATIDASVSAALSAALEGPTVGAQGGPSVAGQVTATTRASVLSLGVVSITATLSVSASDAVVTSTPALEFHTAPRERTFAAAKQARAFIKHKQTRLFAA